MKFQSLSGFRVRCNFRDGLNAGVLHISFNPYRVFEYVATTCWIVNYRYIVWVSIPIGFSSTLQQPARDRLLCQINRFNPYRVFEYVATAGCLATSTIEIGFNPYRVFEYVATF